MLLAPDYVFAATNDALTIWRSNADYVALAAIEKGAQKNDHPINLKASEIQPLLQSIKIAPENTKGFFGRVFPGGDSATETIDSEDLTALFNAKELRDLSPAIARALNSASPDQDILFSTTGQHDSFLGKEISTTAARLFHSDGFLHIILGDTQVDLIKKYRRRGGYGRTPAAAVDETKLGDFRLKTGSRKEITGTAKPLVPGSFQTLKNQKGKVRSDWILVDLPNFRAYLTHQKEQQVARSLLLEEGDAMIKQMDEKQEALSRKVEILERKLEQDNVSGQLEPSHIDQARQHDPQMHPKASASKTSPPARPDPEALKSMDAQTLEQLRELRELKRRDLITDELYETLVRERLERDTTD